MPHLVDKQDEQHARGRFPLLVYLSKSWPYTPVRDDPEGLSGRTARFAYEVFDANEELKFKSDTGIEVVLRETPARQQVKAVFLEDDRRVMRLIFQRFGPKGNPFKDHMSFTGSEVSLLRDFLDIIETVRPRDDERQRLGATAIREAISRADTRRMLYDDHREALVQLIEQDFDIGREIIAVAHRRKVLEHFAELLRDAAHFDALTEKAGGSAEAVWQSFFEANPWLLGLSLAPQFLQSWNPSRLQDVIKGHTVAQKGTRVDALLVTSGLVRSICLVEIKTHRTPLLKGGKPYRGDAWAPTAELSGGIAQCHTATEAARESLAPLLRKSDAEGFETGEVALVARPRSILIIGSSGEFKSEAGQLNAGRYRSFELLRRSLTEPEIVTFDELFERARLSLELLTSVVDMRDEDAPEGPPGKSDDWEPEEAPF